MNKFIAIAFGITITATGLVMSQAHGAEKLSASVCDTVWTQAYEAMNLRQRGEDKGLVNAQMDTKLGHVIVDQAFKTQIVPVDQRRQTSKQFADRAQRGCEEYVDGKNHPTKTVVI